MKLPAAVLACLIVPLNWAAADSPSRAKVLIIGDSIAEGYTPFVRQNLQAKADVVFVRRRVEDDSTEDAVREIDSWLAAEHWTVIHFNWGLWDLKLVNNDGENSVPIERYGGNLRRLIARMKRTDASLIFATTTPVPENVLSVARRPTDAVLYNAVALKIMAESHLHVDDLYTYILPRLAEFQEPSNVHFSVEGSRYLAEKVTQAIDFMLYVRTHP